MHVPFTSGLRTYIPRPHFVHGTVAGRRATIPPRRFLLCHSQGIWTMIIVCPERLERPERVLLSALGASMSGSTANGENENPLPPSPSAGAVRKPNVLRRLYQWVLHWADTPYGTPALAAISFAESSFFPIPPDVLQIALSVSRPKRSFYYAAVAPWPRWRVACWAGSSAMGCGRRSAAFSTRTCPA